MAKTLPNKRITVVFTTDPNAERLYLRCAEKECPDTELKIVRSEGELEQFIDQNEKQIGTIYYGSAKTDVIGTRKLLAFAKTQA